MAYFLKRQLAKPKMQTCEAGIAYHKNNCNQRRISTILRSKDSDNQPLPKELAEPLQNYLGDAVHNTRIHQGAMSQKITEKQKALALTIGNHVYLSKRISDRKNSSQYYSVLAHETVHVRQQPSLKGHDVRSKNLKEIDINENKHSPDYEQEAENFSAGLQWGRYQEQYQKIAQAIYPHNEPVPSLNKPQHRMSGMTVQPIKLTYDDGPDSAGHTKTILRHLNAAKARATFYVIGSRIMKGNNWKVVFDIVASGHWLGNHAYDWNSARDNHIFLNGSPAKRASKILQTEFAIRYALLKGKLDAIVRKRWASIPKVNRAYIEDVIKYGTGRFRTPGFKSKWWTSTGRKTRKAIAIVNDILKSAGLRPMKVSDSVNLDPKDWKKSNDQQDIERYLMYRMFSNKHSVLLHSRFAKTANATPNIIKLVKRYKHTFDKVKRGAYSGRHIGFKPVHYKQSWVKRYLKQAYPIGPAKKRNVTDPIDRTITRQTGIVWAKHYNGLRYLAQITIVNSSISRRTRIYFKTFVDQDLSKLAINKAKKYQSRGIQTMNWRYIQFIPYIAKSSTARK